MNLARRILVAVALALGLLIAARMLFGPFSVAGVPVNVPLNPEGLFGLAITVALVLGTSAQSQRSLSHSGNAPKNISWWIFALVALAAISLRPALQTSFVSDDFIVVKIARDWTWASFISVVTKAGGDGFFRPLGYLSFALDGRWAAINPTLWHASAVTIHVANAMLILLLARRLGLSKLASFLAGSLFALHGTHPEAAVWIAGRFDLLATLFTLGGLLFFLQSIQSETRQTLFQISGLICAAFAVLSKEAAFVLPLLVVVLEAWLRYREPIDRPGAPSWQKVLPYFVVTGAIFIYRSYLLGGIGGYINAGTGQSAFYSLKLSTTAKVVFVRLWTSLYFPINWSSDPSLWLGIAAVLGTAATVWLAWRSRPSPALLVALICLAISILPPLHLLGGAADLSGGRLLYLPSLWFCIFLAAALDGLPGNPMRYAIVGSLILFHFVALQYDLSFWVRASGRVRAACEIAATSANPSSVAGLPSSIDGVPAFANGFAECVELSAGHRIEVNFVRSPVTETSSPDLNSPVSIGPVLVWDKTKELLHPIPARDAR